MSRQLPPSGDDSEDVVELPIDGVLDLHQFRPSDARDVASDYLDACRDKGVLEVRIIHGKGKGVLRRIVHSLLEGRPDVLGFHLANDSGSWGATLVRLRAKDRAGDGGERPGGCEPPSGGSAARTVFFLTALALALVASGCSSDGREAGAGDAASVERASESLVLADNDVGPEVISLLGTPFFRPALSDQRRAELEDNLASAVADYEQRPNDEDATIWYGRRLAYLSRYNDAITVFSRGIDEHPESYKLLRHRGHRNISVRRFDAAIADLQRAAELAADQAVEIEPDGAPNARNIPLSNVHFNIWYHLGLAHYLRGDFEAARDAYLECMKFSDNDDLLVATSDWLYMTYRRLGDEEAAQAVLAPISADMEIIENDAYYRRLLMYKGEAAPEDLLDLRAADDPDVALNIATQGYGVGNWYLVNGEVEAARQVFDRILEGTSWAAFGYIAAEADVARGVGR